MTWGEYKQKQKQIVDEMNRKYSGPSYSERDRAVEKLDEQFFTWCGFTDDCEFTEIEFDCSDIDSEAKKIAGWSMHIGEEYTNLFKDGVLVGYSVVSCRGSQFMMECHCPAGRFAASDRRPNWRSING